MRRSLTAIAALALASATAFVLIEGLRLARFEPPTSDRYAWGAFHAHSTLSDGLGSLNELARGAKDARAAFVLLTDHGPPHPVSTVLDETREGVRIIGGSEVALPEGHLIVSDVDELPAYHLPPYPPDAVDDIAEWGGISVVTYPDDPVQQWRYWEEDFHPDGIEVLNITSDFRASSLLRKLEWAVFSPFNSGYYVSGLRPPKAALERWDALLERGRVLGFYASNAHGGFPLTETTRIRIPSYRTTFAFVGLGIEPRFLDDPAAAVRRGDFFSIVRAAGEPERFSFGIGDGGAVEARLEVRGLKARIDLKRNGSVVDSSRDGSSSHEPLPGVYRVEVYLLDHPLLAPDVPWILSNPLVLGGPPEPESPPPPDCEPASSLALDELRVEKDEWSEAAIAMRDGSLELSYHLSRATEHAVDRWVALARRGSLDLSSFSGIFVDGRAPRPMRYRVELRAGERSHYASFKLTAEPARLVIPWSRFYRTLGGRGPIPLGELDSLFVMVSTGTAPTGQSAEMTLDAIGFCR